MTHSEANLFFLLILWCACCTFAGKISNHPQTIQADEGGKATIVCIVQELEDGEVVSWVENSVIISKGVSILNIRPSRYQIDADVEKGHYFLVLDPVQRSDKTSEFACGIYKNDANIVLSDVAQITINEIPDRIYPDCSNKKTEYKNGRILKLSCTSEIVNPEPRLKWLTDKSNLKSTLQKSNNMITITHQLPITPNLNGETFICNLKSDAKVDRNCTVGPLNVVYKPLIELNGEDLVKQGNVYICSVNANPEVTKYRWIFVPDIGEDQYNIETGDRTLRLKELRPDQNGTIMECEATNRIGVSAVQKILYLPPSHIHIPSTLNPSQQSKDSGKMSSTKILSFVGSCLLLLACLMAVLLCIFVAHSRRYLPGVRVPQPDVYFMPKDSISTMGRNSGQTAGVWKRSIGTQVPSDLDRESIYLEIGERKTLM